MSDPDGTTDEGIVVDRTATLDNIAAVTYPTELRLARQATREWAATRASRLLASEFLARWTVRQLPVALDHPDATSSLAVVHGLLSPSGAIDEAFRIWRILTPYGSVSILGWPEGHPDHQTPQRVLEHLALMGVEHVELTNPTPGQTH